MGSWQRRALDVLLVLLLAVVGVLTEQSSSTTASLGSHRGKASRSLRRFLKRKLKQNPNPRGLERHLMEKRAGNFPPKIPEQSATVSDRMAEYLSKADAAGAIAKYPDDHGRDLRRRPKRNWYGRGKGGKSLKGSKKSSKRYGKGKGKKSSKKGIKGIDSNSLGNICRGLDFGGRTSFNDKGFAGNWNRRKGRGKRRELDQIERSLQFGGELCYPNAFVITSSNPDLSIFAELVEAANLEEIFLCTGPFTLLAPSNAAFNANPTLLRTFYNPRNIEALQQLLLYHILPGFYTSDDFVAGPIKTLLGEDVDIALEPLSVNQATALTVDILACNGAINIIDDLLIPPGSPVLPEICNVLDFRSDDQSPALTRIESVFFHRNLEVEDETGIAAIGDRKRKLQFEGERCRLNVIDVAQESPLLETFVGLVNAADLEDIFLCAGPFTVLAPTNDSFEYLDSELLETMIQPENQELLQEILLYHILPGFFPSDELQEGPIETLLFGKSLEVGLDPIRFDDAGVVRPDEESCNGIIHIINDILLPEEPDICDVFTFEDHQDKDENSLMTVLEVARQDPDFSTVVDLIELADLEEVLDCPGPFTALLPTNTAFEAFDPDYLEFLRDPANRDELEELLLYHILPGATPSDNFSAGPTETLLFDETVDVGESPLTFDEADVITADIPADNGIIDKIDTVLTPFPLPTSAPAAAPTVAPDICVDYTFGRRLRMLQDGGEDCSNNVYETALEDPELQVITSLIKAAGLEPIFSCAGPFTALLPTNTAFDNVDPEYIQELLLPENIEDLQNLLLYHILPGATLTTEFTAGPTDTLFPENQIEVGLDPTQFDNADVLTPNIVACNGYIDVIDTVLDPFAGPVTSAPTAGPIAGTGAPVVATDEPTAAPVVGTDAPVASTDAPVASADAPTIAPIVASNAPSFAPSTSPLADGATRAPTEAPKQLVRVQDYFIAYVIDPKADREPTEEEYIEMNVRSAAHFADAIEAFYAGRDDVTFLGVESAIEDTGFQQGIPEERFDIFIDFEFADVAYTLDSTPPPTAELFTIMSNAITVEYITDVVRTLTGTPFENCVEVRFDASERLVAAP